MEILIPMFILLIIVNNDYVRISNNQMFKNGNTQKKVFFSFALLVIIAAIRYDVGYDYMNYYNFVAYNASYKETLNLNFALIPRIIIQIAVFFKQPWIFFFISEMLIVIFIYLGIKDQEIDINSAIIVYVSLFYVESLSIIRQALALSVVFWSFKYVREKKLICFLMIILLAVLCHESALIGLCIYFIYNYFSLKATFTLIALYFSLQWIIQSYFLELFKQFVSMMLQINILRRFANYFNGNYNQILEGASKTKIYFILLFVYVFIYYLIICKKRKHRDIEFEKALTIPLIAILLSFFIFSDHVLMRISMYLNITYIFLVPKLISEKEVIVKYKKTILLFPFVMYYLIYLITDYINTSGYSPFHFYFSKA